MKIQSLSLHPYSISMKNGSIRTGILVDISDETGMHGWGDIAPLPHWSRETLEDALGQYKGIEQQLLQEEWTAANFLFRLQELELYPSLSFALESALFSLLQPLPPFSVTASALFMGSPNEILEQAKIRKEEGFVSAKLKVSHLSFKEALSLINGLKNDFRLRIDVNRAWDTEDSLRFFSQFSADAFDYVEEPFKVPEDLAQFTLPLAVDESFPEDLSFAQLAELPALKALIYKPTIQGGLAGCLPLCKWAEERGVSVVISSCFESDIGLAYVASIAHRLSLKAPAGLGTYHYMENYLNVPPLRFSEASLHVESISH